MTGTQIYEQALVLLGLEEENNEQFDGMVLGCLNQLIADNFSNQNILHQLHNGHRMHGIPVLQDIEDEVCYDELFVRECFPYGLAALLIAEDDHTMFDWVMNEYERRTAYYAPCIVTELENPV